MRYIHVLLVIALFACAHAADRYEAENAIVDENSVQKVADSSASGGFYVNMKDGSLSFKVTVSTAGFYTLWATYSQPNDTNGKVQNLSVNGSSVGQISFPFNKNFVTIKASAKIKLSQGIDTIAIMKSWGWVNLDYIELTPYIATPFAITNTLVSPNASDNAKKIYGFLRQNFQKKVVSGVMTSSAMQNDGKYSPVTIETQTEVAWIIAASGKTPALLGLDFIHATGLASENEWHRGYTKAMVALGETVYKRGGIPAFCWHWKDPLDSVETFYSPSSGNPYTTFNLNKAFSDSNTYTAFNTNSTEYKAIIKNLDTVAGYLKTLADKDIPILWRPLHESSGKWFWWGYKGPDACKALYRLMFDRFTKVHGLNNLIWVWTTDEADDALSWYPGDAYVDIVGRDFYYYPEIANHGSLVASFEKVKDLFSGKKIISLAECGSVPFPDEMTADGAGWSYFMPWYGPYTMDGWAHDNTAADWKSIMNNSYVITLDKMPGWDSYVPMLDAPVNQRSRQGVSVRYNHGSLELVLTNTPTASVKLYNGKGVLVADFNVDHRGAGAYRFKLKPLAQGMYFVRVKISEGLGSIVRPVLISGK